MTTFIIEGLVSEPWTAPTFVRRGNGGYASKNERLRIYQNALAEAVRDKYPNAPCLDCDITFDLYIWRELEQYETESGRRQTRKRADRSNLLKATEDALQGILFFNDRQIRDGRTHVVKQEVGIESLIEIRIEEWVEK